MNILNGLMDKIGAGKEKVISGIEVVAGTTPLISGLISPKRLRRSAIHVDEDGFHAGRWQSRKSVPARSVFPRISVHLFGELTRSPPFTGYTALHDGIRTGSFR